MSDVARDELGDEESWPEPIPQEERDRIEAEVWDPDVVKVWPLGPGGPSMTLRELAAWRAEQERMREALQRPDDDGPAVHGLNGPG